MCGFYQKQVEKILDSYGDFLLINTNFNHVNAFLPDRNLFQPLEKPGEEPSFGRAARGMPRQYAEGLRDHKQAVFEDFQKLIPALDKAFPDYNIVVRPHPTESQDIYRSSAARCERVQITNEGNVVPWLMATRALIHNGCTTGVEAYLLRVPAISYRQTVNETYDYGFYQLPNRLSHQCFDLDELRAVLQSILSGELGAAEGDERQALIDRHLVAQDGPLACDRITDILEKMVESLSSSPKPPFRGRLVGRLKATKLRKRQQSRSRDLGFRQLLEFHRHKYPQISLEELCERTARFQHLLGHDVSPNVDLIYDNLFLISP